MFQAGASHYGVADCELLAQETHKFESRYLDLLIGPYPKDKAVYEQRSPIHSIDGFSSPIIFFQVSRLPQLSVCSWQCPSLMMSSLAISIRAYDRQWGPVGL